jgi:hypothetical protein
MEKIMIKGKPYVQVNQRVLELRHKYGDKDNMFGIKTKVVEWNKEKNEIIVQAWITDQTGRIVGSGIAHEEKTQSGVNSTSYVENCETSAIGRALAAFGLGIEDAYASADEVQGAIKKQDEKKEKKSKATKKDLTEMMDVQPQPGAVQEASTDPYYVQYKTALAKVFIEGSDSRDASELLDFVVADFNDDTAEAVIEAHAHANPGNKEVLKQYCEQHISLWKNTMNSADYDSLVIFMKYLSGKFPEEVA